MKPQLFRTRIKFLVDFDIAHYKNSEWQVKKKIQFRVRQLQHNCSAIKYARDATRERTHFRDIDEQRNQKNQSVRNSKEEEVVKEKKRNKANDGDPSFALAQVPRGKVVYELVIVDCVDDNMFR